MSNAWLGTAALAVLAGLVLSAGLPFIGYVLLEATSRLDRANGAAIAAHYGSISVVTFIAASDAGLVLGFAAAGFMVAVTAAIEAPATFSGLMLAPAPALEEQLTRDQPASLEAGTYARGCPDFSRPRTAAVFSPPRIPTCDSSQACRGRITAFPGAPNRCRRR